MRDGVAGVSRGDVSGGPGRQTGQRCGGAGDQVVTVDCCFDGLLCPRDGTGRVAADERECGPVHREGRGHPSELAAVHDHQVRGRLRQQLFDVVEAEIDAVELVAGHQAADERDREHGAFANDVIGKLAGPSADEVLAPFTTQRPEGQFHEVSCPFRVSAGQRVPDRGLGLPCLGVPARGSTMQVWDVAGSFVEQVRVQDVSEEVVVAVPAPVVVERDEEQVRSVHGLEHRSATPVADPLRYAADRVAQRAGEPIEDRGVEQEAAYVVGLPTEDLVGEVVDDEPVVASEPGDEACPVVAVAQREGRQLEGGDPSLRAGLERCEVGGREVEAVEVVEVAGHLLNGEAKVRRADLDELPASPQPRKRQRRIGSGADDQPKLRRQVVDEERHPGRDIDTVSEVVVVQDDGDLTGIHAQLVHQRPRARSRPAPAQTAEE